MKVSYNWLRQYIETDLEPNALAELMTSIGLEVEGVEPFYSIPGGLEGLVIGEVLSCGEHPNADRLSLTTVSVGVGEPLSIVCGAPNVAAAQKVVVATVGTTIHPTEGAGFTIEKRKVRGEASEGMICAEDEIGLGTSHEGIMVLPEDAPVGQAAADYFEVERDTVFEVGLTPNRSDATGHLGCAFDIAAALNIQLGKDARFSKPTVDDFKVDNKNLSIDIVVENEAACPRYAGLCIEGLEIKESPAWLQNRLKAIGISPKNNVVDITNYVLHELGQPLHAFDYDKIDGQQVRVKNLPKGTKFVTLDEQKRQLRAGDLMICDAESKPMCMAGIFGGLHSGVTEQTQRLFLESAYFEAKAIRRSSTHHLLRTDAAGCYEKGADPNKVIYALKRAALLIKELANGKIASEIIDVYPENIERARVRLRYAQIERLLGLEIPNNTVKAILQALDMEIVEEKEEAVVVTIPTDKADVTREADIIEELLRIYGMDKIPTPEKLRSVLAYAPKPNPHKLRNLAADWLASNGFNEMMALSLNQSGHYTHETLGFEEKDLVFVNNTSNRNLDIMRPSMIISGLETIVYNLNRQQPDLKFFEFGRTYHHEAEQQYSEQERLTLWMTGKRHPESWLYQEQREVDFFSLKSFAEGLLERLGLDPSNVQHSSFENEGGYSYGLHYHRGKQSILRFGRLHPSLLKHHDIKQPVFYADFLWENVLKAIRKHEIKVKALSKFPSVRRDLALVVDREVQFADIVGIAVKAGKKLLQSVNLFDLYENEEQLGADKKSYALSFIFRDESKTLKSKEVDKIMNTIMKQAEQRVKAMIRQ